MSQYAAAGKRTTVRSYMIKERAEISKCLLGCIGNEGAEKALHPDVSSLGSLLRDIPLEIGWKRVYINNSNEQDSTGLLNDHWDRDMVMRRPATACALNHTAFFTYLPRGSAGKVQRDTVCRGNWSNRDTRSNDGIFSPEGNLVGRNLSYSRKADKNYEKLNMLEITLKTKDASEPKPLVALCLIYKVNSSAPVYIIDSLLCRLQNHDPTGQHNLGTATDQNSSDGADDSKSSPQVFISGGAKNCKQMGIGNVAYSSYNIRSKSVRDYLVRAVSRHVDAYLQDCPLEATEIPDLSEDDNQFIEGSVVHMLVGLGILPHIMESKYSVEENKRLGKRKVGPDGSSQVFEENKKAFICEAPININNTVMHDFTNRCTTYSFESSKFPGISQAPHVVTTRLSQPKALCTSQGFWSASTTDHTMGGNTSQTVPEDGAELNGMIEHEPHAPTDLTSTPMGRYPHFGAPADHAAGGNVGQQQDMLGENGFHNGVSNLPNGPENGANPTGLLEEVVGPFLIRKVDDVYIQKQRQQLPSHPILTRNEKPCPQGMQADKFTTFDDVSNPMQIQMDQLEPHTLTGPASVPIANHHLGAPTSHAAEGNELEQQMRSDFTMEDMPLDVLNEIIFHNGVSNLPQDPENGAKPTGLLDEDRATFVASETGNQTNCDDAVRQKIPFPQDKAFPQDMQANGTELLRESGYSRENQIYQTPLEESPLPVEPILGIEGEVYGNLDEIERLGDIHFWQFPEVLFQIRSEHNYNKDIFSEKWD